MRLEYAAATTARYEQAARNDGQEIDFHAPGQARTGIRRETSHPGRSRRMGDWWLDSVRAILADGGLLMDPDGQPLGLHLATQGFAERHFATYPERLVEPFILSGTSQQGACPACGAPWARVVEKIGGTIGTENASWAGARTDGGSWNTPAEMREQQKSYRVNTLGWRPTCACGREDTVPCVVLDPFAGAGTTLLVADRLGRDSIGIELNPEYAAMALRRLAKDAPLFVEMT